jgi:hypothetical protein
MNFIITIEGIEPDNLAKGILASASSLGVDLSKSYERVPGQPNTICIDFDDFAKLLKILPKDLAKRTSLKVLIRDKKGHWTEDWKITYIGY